MVLLTTAGDPGQLVARTGAGRLQGADAASGRRYDTIGVLLVLTGGTLFGCVVVLAKLLSASPISVPAALAFRFGFCAAILLILTRALGVRLVPAAGERFPLVAVASLFYAAEASLFFAALHHGNAATVTVLFYIYPVFMLIASLLLKQVLPRRYVTIAVLLGVAGALLTGGADRLSIDPAGTAMVLGSAVLYTGYITTVHRTLHVTNSLTATMWVTACVGAIMLLIAGGTRELSLPGGPAEWAELVGMGLGTAVGTGCAFAGLRRIGPVRTSVLATVEPLAAGLLAFIALREPIRTGTLVGGALILTSAVLAARARPAVSFEAP